MRLEGCTFEQARVADTLNCICSASDSANLLFLMADSVAVRNFSTGICSGVTAKFNIFLQLGKLYVRCVLMCCDVDVLISV